MFCHIMHFNLSKKCFFVFIFNYLSGESPVTNKISQFYNSIQKITSKLAKKVHNR